MQSKISFFHTLKVILSNPALIKKEDDEVVFAIAEELSNIGPVLGAQHTAVLPIL